jgi:hypothetical protein
VTKEPEPTQEEHPGERDRGDDHTLAAQAGWDGKTAEESFHWYLNPSS